MSGLRWTIGEVHDAAPVLRHGILAAVDKNIFAHSGVKRQVRRRVQGWSWRVPTARSSGSAS